MAFAVRRDDDPHLTIDLLQSWIADIRSVCDAAAMIAGEEFPPEKERFILAGLIDCARRMLKQADEDINRVDKAFPAIVIFSTLGPALIGGARITVGDSVIDGTVQAKLQAMATQLRA